MQVQSEKYGTIGKLEYRILWCVSKHILLVKARHKGKCKIEKNKLKHIGTDCLNISK